MAYKYTTIVVGGTFGLLHKGHQAFLRYAFSLAKEVYITITSDVYTSLHKPDAKPFTEREKTVEEFLAREGFLSRAKIISIDDVYGITSQEAISLNAILVTQESLPGAEKVNEKRKESGLLPLVVEVMPLFESDMKLPISATFIRNGIIDEKGQLLINNQVLFLPQNLRAELQLPFGKIVNKATRDMFPVPEKIFAVGDVTTKTLHNIGIYPKISVIDFLVERIKQQKSLYALGFTGEEKVLQATNPPGEITPSLWQSLTAALSYSEDVSNVVIVVDGEEDLAVLPLILLAPSGFVICYGQPKAGMVIVEVNEQVKKHAVDIILRFEQATTRGH